MYGRHLAGYGDVELESSDEQEPEQGTALNELKYLQEMDDSAGSGIFDAPGTRPNIHTDEGIFADRMALPGYVQRDPMYTPSEVKSVTTGRPVTYVNAGAVAMDDAAQVAFLENRWLNPPQPVVNRMRGRPVPSRSTANVFQNPVPPAGAAPAATSGLGELAPVVNFALGAGVVGLAAGVLYGLLRRKR